ncbi:MAG: hypothetical protein ATN34_05385 [Epulopiscium sp. Nele67-Bin002]|nr:MAG: hypothetical protein ATN34_05385 [Epulopiscium sp. Nele67-Bin002]
MKKSLVAIVLILMVGCTSIVEDDENVTLDWYINYSWFKHQWGYDVVSQAISDIVGVDIQFVTPIGEESNKLSTILQTNNLPDIITLGWDDIYVSDLIKSDRVYALNELDELYNVGFKEECTQQTYEWYTQNDGNIYGYPNSSYLPSDYEFRDDIGSNQVFIVRKDIYKAIGEPDMSTMEGFKSAVKAAASLYNDIIPVGSTAFNSYGSYSFDVYLQNFLAVPFEKDGVYYDRNTDNEYIAWLKMFNELFREGYLYPEIFTDQKVQFEEKFAQGKYFCVLYQRTDITDQQKTLAITDPEKIYIAIDGPKNSNGDDHVLPGVGINGWTLTFISKDCADPKKALELMTYMLSEQGQFLTVMGVEGVTFEWVDNRAVFKPSVSYLLNTNRELFDQIYGANYTYWMLQNNRVGDKWIQQDVESLQQLAQWTYPYTHYMAQYDISFAHDAQLSKLNNKIKTLWGDYLIQLLLASSAKEFTQLLAQYINDRDLLGYDIIIEESTHIMNEAKYKLGLD